MFFLFLGCGPWDTAAAQLKFANGGAENDTIHQFDIEGKDNGPKGTNDFAWFLLNITNQTRINLHDSDGDVGGALYVKVLEGADVNPVTRVVNNIFGDATSTLNIYYNKTLPANAYLGGLDYKFASGNGQLIADDPVAVMAPTLATYSTNQTASFTGSNISASTGVFNAAAATNNQIYGLAKIYSMVQPLIDYPYMSWKKYDF